MKSTTASNIFLLFIFFETKLSNYENNLEIFFFNLNATHNMSFIMTQFMPLWLIIIQLVSLIIYLMWDPMVTQSRVCPFLCHSVALKVWAIDAWGSSNPFIRSKLFS